MRSQRDLPVGRSSAVMTGFFLSCQCPLDPTAQLPWVCKSPTFHRLWNGGLGAQKRPCQDCQSSSFHMPHVSWILLGRRPRLSRDLLRRTSVVCVVISFEVRRRPCKGRTCRTDCSGCPLPASLSELRLYPDADRTAWPHLQGQTSSDSPYEMPELAASTAVKKFVNSVTLRERGVRR